MIFIEDLRETTRWVPAQRTIEAVLRYNQTRALSRNSQNVLADRGGPRQRRFNM